MSPDFIIKENTKLYQEAKAIIEEMDSFIPQIVKADNEITLGEYYAYTDRYHKVAEELDMWFLKVINHIKDSNKIGADDGI